MIEEIMIFALGFLVAGLLALLILPLFWRRALRLSRRRVEMQLPLSMAEILAERDRLRAEFAVERCRLEQSIATMSDKQSAALARTARAEMASAQLRARAEEAEKATQAGEFQVRELEAQVGMLSKELYDADSMLVARTQALAALRAQHNALSEAADERRAMNAALETRLSGLEMRFADALRELDTARAERARNADQAASARAEAVAADRKYRELAGVSGANERRLADLSAALTKAQRELDESRALSERFSREASLAEERAIALRNSLERQSESRRTRDGELAERLEESESQMANLRAALEDARRENGELSRAANRRRRSPGREPRSLKGLEVIAAERQEDRNEPPRAEDSLLNRPA